ncbi:MAG: YwiC-like family protein [Ignavibacteria bacterium]|nr:YwiC-like family protein [Ignavibacteria bacterium]
MTVSRPVIPKEHGAWAVLVVPMIVGASVSGRVTVDLVLLLLCALLVFLGTIPLQTLLRHRFDTRQSPDRVRQARVWGTWYLLGGFIAAVPLLLDGRVFLPVLAMIGSGTLMGNFLLTRSQPKTIQSDFLAVAGLCLGAPAAYYVATGVVDRTALVLWLLNVLFFGWTVFYVQMKIRAVSYRKDRLVCREKIALSRQMLSYNILVLAIVTFCVLQKLATPYAAIAFLPVTAHALIGTVRLTAKVRFRKLGFALLGHSMIFGFILGFLR